MKLNWIDIKQRPPQDGVWYLTLMNATKPIHLNPYHHCNSMHILLYKNGKFSHNNKTFAFGIRYYMPLDALLSSGTIFTGEWSHDKASSTQDNSQA